MTVVRSRRCHKQYFAGVASGGCTVTVARIGRRRVQGGACSAPRVRWRCAGASGPAQVAARCECGGGERAAHELQRRAAWAWCLAAAARQQAWAQRVREHIAADAELGRDGVRNCGGRLRQGRRTARRTPLPMVAG